MSANTTKPTVTALSTVSENAITIQYTTSAGSAVELFQKVGGNYTTTGQKGTGSGALTVTTDAKQSQCFQVRAQSSCPNDPPLASDEVCSLVLNATAGNKENKLTWQPYASSAPTTSQFYRYRVLRNGSQNAILTNQNQSTYTDNNKIECGTQYCYSLEATINGTPYPTTITSAPICVTGNNGEQPTAVSDVIVSIENDYPRLVVALPVSGTSSSYTLVITRTSGSSGAAQEVARVDNNNVFADANADPSAGSYCYQVTYLSKCGLSSPPSSPVCTIFLTSKSSTGLDWTAESPFLSGNAQYTLEILDSVSNARRTVDLGGNTHYEPDPNDPSLQAQRYRVVGVSAGGVPSYSNYFTLRREVRILIPDAFTPNGDGMNDVFLPKGIYVDKFLMSIYDRWGEVIYSTTDKTKGWDGTANGQYVIAGQYMYRIELEDQTGVKTVRTGALLLVR